MIRVVKVAGILCAAVLATTATPLIDPASARAKDELAAVRERATQAARDVADAETELALTQQALAANTNDSVVLSAHIEQLKDRVRRRTIQLYVGRSPSYTPDGIKDVAKEARARGLMAPVAARERADTQDLVDALAELRQQRAAIERARDRRRQALADLRDSSRALEQQLARLTALANAQAAEKAERLASRATSSSRSSSASSSASHDTSTARPSNSASASASSSRSVVNSTAPTVTTSLSPSTSPLMTKPSTRASTTSTSSTTRVTVPPLSESSAPSTTSVPPTSSTSASTSSESSVTSTIPTAATTTSIPPSAPVTVGAEFICPVAGPTVFTDTWGAPRSQGWHQGTDVFASKGTPVVANVSGVFKQHPNRLGGLAYYLAGSDGVEYYGAHLDAYAAESGPVSVGTVLGYVGNTGDAAATPAHLHFEVHPASKQYSNPYPILKAVCS